MKILISLCFFLGVYSLSWTQEKYSFVGLLQAKNIKTPMLYKVDIQVAKDGTVRGFSYSDIGKKTETKAEVSGSLKGDKLVLKETKVIYSLQETNQFCLLSVTGRLKNKNSDETAFSGTFKGYINGDKNKSCGTGNVVLTSKEKILKESEKYIGLTPSIVNEDKKKKEEEEKNKAEENKVRNTSATESLTSSKNGVFYTSAPALSLSVIDNNDEDGDVIAVEIDGVLIQDNIRLTKSVQHINIPLKSGKSDQTITIISKNSGRVPPTTAKIILSDKGESKTYILDIDMGKKAQIQVKR